MKPDVAHKALPILQQVGSYPTVPTVIEAKRSI